MIAIDTNVLVRYLTKDDPKQFQQAERLIRGGHKVFIDDLVLVETIWLLSGRRYNATPEDVCAAVESLISEPNIQFHDSGRIWITLSRYKQILETQGPKPDFADLLICERSKSVVESTGENLEGWYTFDKGAQLIQGAHVVPS